VSNQILSKQPIYLSTQLTVSTSLCNSGNILGSSGTTNNDYGVTCLQAPYSYIDGPLQVAVPNGVPVDIGIVGAYYDPFDILGDNDTNAIPDGVCDQLVAPGGSVSRKSFTLFGHTTVTPNPSTSVTLPVNILEANPPNPFTYTITGISSQHDWVQLDFPAGPTLVTVGYLQNPDGTYAINQQVNPATAPTKVYVPSIFPLQLTFLSTNLYQYTASGSLLNTSITACQIGVSNPGCSLSVPVTNYNITTY